MEELIKSLHEGNYSCVIENVDGVHFFSGKGVSDLYALVKEQNSFLNGASVADKVVGKAAAALMILGGVKNVYTDLISAPALEMFEKGGINVSYSGIVPNIRNRDNTDLCPLEKKIGANDQPEIILSLVDEFIETMKRNKH